MRQTSSAKFSANGNKGSYEVTGKASDSTVQFKGRGSGNAKFSGSLSNGDESITFLYNGILKTTVEKFGNKFPNFSSR